MPWLLILSLFWFAAAVAVIVRAFVQRNALQQLKSATIADGVAPMVAVIVPARDEAHNIERCIRGLLSQHYPPERLTFRIFDDGSRDETAAIVRRLANTEPRLHLLTGFGLPSGWTGKAHACWLAARNLPCEVQWLCFIDADMCAQPGLLASAVLAAQDGNLSLLSLAPRHELETFAERLMIPCGLSFLALRQDLRGTRPEHDGDAVATGQFFLVRRAVYDASRGHAAVASEICEDLALARLLKRRGERVAMRDASGLLSTRMYTGWATLWPGFAKNLTEMLGGPIASLTCALVAFLLGSGAIILPAVDVFRCRAADHAACLAAIPASLATAAMFGLHIAIAAHVGVPLWYGVLWPLGYITGAAMVLDSLRWRLLGRVWWKGRSYTPGGGTALSR